MKTNAITISSFEQVCMDTYKVKQEEWRDIPGYEGLYQISNFGNAKSLHFGRNKLLKMCPTAKNKTYLGVSLSKNGKIKMFLGHQLVAMAFLNYSLEGYESVVDHIDNNGHNNNLENLQVITHSANLRKNRRANAISQHVGVTSSSKQTNKKFRSAIKINGKLVYLGTFASETVASWIFNAADDNKHLYNGNQKEFREICQKIVFDKK